MDQESAEPMLDFNRDDEVDEERGNVDEDRNRRNVMNRDEEVVEEGRNANEPRNRINVMQRRADSTVPLCTVDPNNRIPRRFEKSIARLMMKDDCKRYHNYCKFLILRINCATSIGNKEEKFDYYNYKGKGSKNSKNSSFYQRLFLLLDLEDETGGVYYVVQNSSIHSNMWNYNRSIRDNGVITIGATVCILNPKPIMNILANDIPIIETDHPFVTLLPASPERSIDICQNLPANDTRGFIIHGSRIQLHTYSCRTGLCSGYFCDRQRVVELDTMRKGCGCYHTGRNCSIVFKFDMQASYNSTVIEISDYTSVQFQEIFLNGKLPLGCGEETFGVTTSHYENLFETFSDIFTHVNNLGGWTILGWSKRGHINDFCSEHSTTGKVDSAEVTHHVVNIYPSDSSAVLTGLKFDTSALFGI